VNEVPKVSKLIKPVFDALKQLGGSGTNLEINQIVATNLKLSKDAVEKMYKDMRRTELEYNLQWARTNLKNANYIENSKRGVWNIVSTYIDDEIDNEKAKEISKIRRNTMAKEINSMVKAITKKEEIELEEDDGDFESSLKEKAKSELSDLLKQMNPFAFERLTKRLLREMGFEEVNVTKKTQDGGIDGFGKLKINGIVTFNIAFQCKRYNDDKVSSKEIRDFRGSLSSNIEKGIFITTGKYSERAKKEASADGKKNIDLIDGNELIEKII